MTNKLIWRQEAINQLEKIRRYISNDSKKSAKKVVKEIRLYVKGLKEYSFIGQEEENLKKLFKRDRDLVVGSYKVIYRFENQIVYILAVFDTRRNPTSLESEISKE
jgi:toxin ParE1/3/4